MKENGFELILQPDAKGVNRFMRAVEASKSVKGCVAFWTLAINDSKYEGLIEKLKTKNSFMCVDFHKPTNIDHLAKWKKSGGNIYLYTYQFRLKRQTSVSDVLDDETSKYLMHSKIFVFEFEQYSEVWIGSHNMTKRAMEGPNKESSVILRLDNNDKELKNILDYLEKIKKESELFDVQKIDTYKYFQQDLSYEHDFVIECFYSGNLEDLKVGSTITYLGEDQKEFEEYRLINRKLKLYVFNRTENALYEIKIINAGGIDKNSPKSYSMTFSERLVAVKKSGIIAVFTEEKRINEEELKQHGFYVTFDIKRKIENTNTYNISKNAADEWIKVNSDINKINPEFSVRFQKVKLQKELKRYITEILRIYNLTDYYGFEYLAKSHIIEIYDHDDMIERRLMAMKEELPYIRLKIFVKRYFATIEASTQKDNQLTMRF